MNEVVSTIYYNGQFWVALIEKSDGIGLRYLAEYTFGPEPTTGVLLDFYLNKYQCLRFVKSDRIVRLRKHKKDNVHRVSRSHDEYRENLSTLLELRKAEKTSQNRIAVGEKYKKKILKKKEKKKGH